MEPSVGFPPIARADARILILGSLPGRRSLKMCQYYAHDRNAFWPIMAATCGVSGDYEQRCRLLVDARIALWDVLKHAERAGSLDSNIRLGEAQENDFAGFFDLHPDIRCVAFNGKKAEAMFRKRVIPDLDFEIASLVSLPSTSPAHASLSFDKKLDIWRSMLVTEQILTKQ